MHRQPGPVSRYRRYRHQGRVSFWPIDARGLVAEAPLGDATQGSQGNAGIYTGAAALATTANFQQSRTPLRLAGDTGGKVLLDSNDLTRVSCRRASYLRLLHFGLLLHKHRTGWQVRRQNLRRPGQDAKLDYRQGYYRQGIRQIQCGR